jgi:predicted ribosomally synthesized peptide with nif11-like leader
MTEAEVQRFLQAIEKQPDLVDKLQAEGADPLAIAAEAGFAFEADELTAVLGRLTDAELDRVVGGIGSFGAPIPRPPGGSGPSGPPIYGGDDDPMNTMFADC